MTCYLWEGALTVCHVVLKNQKGDKISLTCQPKQNKTKNKLKPLFTLGNCLAHKVLYHSFRRAKLFSIQERRVIRLS